MDEEALLEGSQGKMFFCHPKRTPFRMVMLVVIAMICFGSYFSVDEIQNLGPLWTNAASKYVRSGPVKDKNGISFFKNIKTEYSGVANG